MADKADRLKLADAQGDTAPDKVADARLRKEAAARIRELETNVADLQKLVKDKKKLEQRVVAENKNNKLGARKDASFKAISTAPSINHTPVGPAMVPVPYPTVQDLGSSVKTARSVNFNGAPAYLLDHTSQPGCRGDQAGTGGGIRSGTVGGEVKPVSGTSTVRIEGKPVVREGDACTMNGGNNPGAYVTAKAPSSAPPKNALDTSNPPIFQSEQPPSNAFEEFGRKNFLGLRRERTVSERISDEVISEMLSSKAALQSVADQIHRMPAGPRLEPMAFALEEKQLRTRNSLEISLLGIFGLHGIIARASGGNETMVAQANKMGAATMGVLGSIGGPSGSLTQESVISSETVKDFSIGNGLRIVGNIPNVIIRPSYNVQTKPNEAFFWSGRTNGYGGDMVARQIAQKSNGTTLEMLIEKNGIKMPDWNTDNLGVVAAWKNISSDYAAGVSGIVKVVLGKELRPGNVWETAEMPALMRNENVKEIIAIDPVTQTETKIYERLVR